MYHMCVFCQIDLRDDPKTLARLLYMKEKPLTYEHGVKLAKAVPILNFIFNGFWETSLLYALEWKSYIGFCFKMQCVQNHLSALYISSVQVRLEGTMWLAFLSASTVWFSLRKKFDEFKQLKHLSFDLATSRISICHIEYE